MPPRPPRSTPFPYTTLFRSPGAYEVRFFSSNSYARLATSGLAVVQAQPTLTISDVSLNEGNSGKSTGTYSSTLGTVYAAQQVKINYATADGRATVANNHYVA